MGSRGPLCGEGKDSRRERGKWKTDKTKGSKGKEGENIPPCNKFLVTDWSCH